MTGNRAEYYEDVADGREDYYAENDPTTGSESDEAPAGDDGAAAAAAVAAGTGAGTVVAAPASGGAGGSATSTVAAAPVRRENARGRWLGAGAEQLGLQGGLIRGELSRLVSDQHPRTGEMLGARNRMKPTRRQGPGEKSVTAVPVSGWDLTFSAPKSVSVLYALGEDEVRDAVQEAHDAAVTEALAFVERHAAFTRRGAGGVDVVAGDGFIAAAFRHVTSRAGDPQLHSHVVVSNLISAAGRYTRLDARPLLKTLKTGSYVYQASLRAQLTERLGLRWAPTVNGHADLQGVPDAVIGAFSTRAQEIRELLDERGQSSAAAAQSAALSSRKAKDYAVSTPQLRSRWAQTAAEHDFTAADIQLLVGQAGALPPSAEQLQEIADRLLGPQGLTAENATFAYRDVVRAWAEAHPYGATPERLEQLADWTIGQPGVRELDRTAHGATYSTQELLDLEQGLTVESARRVGEGTAIVDHGLVDAAVGSRPTMTDEQVQMVRSLTESGAGIELVRGYAGAGKTFALEAAREAWEAGGLRVFGAAIAGKAAEGLQAGSGIPSSTVARLLMDLRDGHGLPRGGVLVIDEAGMIGTRLLYEIATHAAQTQTKLVLVGDDAQLPELQAGGSFAALAESGQVSELVKVRRQRDPGDIELLSRIRHGHADAALQSLADTGRVIAGARGEETRELLVRDWLRDEQALEGRGVIVVRSRADERDLAARARAQLRLGGRLGEDLVEIKGRAFAQGDRVICGQNRSTLGVMNGTAGTVQSYADGKLAVLTDTGHLVQLPDAYMAGRRSDGRAFLEHGYAITGTRAQGATWARSYVLADDGTYQQEAYTQLSRHTDTVRLYVVNTDRLPDDPAPEGLKRTDTQEQDPLEALGRAMSRSRAKSTASSLAAEAGSLRLADEAALRRELAELQAALEIPAMRVQRAQTLERQLARDTESLDRLLTLAENGPISRSQRDAVTKLVARLKGARDHRQQLGELEQHREPLERAKAIRGELHRRQAIAISTQVRAAAAAPPPHLTAVLGPRPVDPDERATWDRGTLIVENYRTRFAPHLTPEQAGLEPRPASGPEARAWYAFERQLNNVLTQLDPTGLHDHTL